MNSKIKKIQKIYFSSVIACLVGLLLIGVALWFSLFVLLGLDYKNSWYGLVAGVIGSIYFSWYKSKQKSLNVFGEE